MSRWRLGHREHGYTTRLVKLDAGLGVVDYGSSGVIGFLIGYKLLMAFTDYNSFVTDPQSFLISMDGSVLGGILGAAISVGWRWYDKKKELEEHPKPTEIEEERHPYQHVGNMTMIAAFFGLFGAKVFHLLENPDEVSGMFESVDSFFSGLTMYGGLIVGR